MASDTPVTVMLVDDHPMVRAGLASMLTASGFDVVGEASNGAEGVALAAELVPDVVLMDIRMPEMDGIEAVTEIRAQGLKSRVLIVTTYGTTRYLLECLAAGAAGFVLKSIPADELVQTIRDVADGAMRVDENFLGEVLSSMEDPSGSAEEIDEPIQELTKREHEVLQLIVVGMSNQAIAASLGITVYTLKGYVQAIFQKLLVSDRTQAAVKAIRLGLV